MTVFLALLRGVNVAGKNRLGMAELVRELERVGCRDVRTYVQSGNVVLRAPGMPRASLAAKIADAIAARFGFRPHVAVLSAAEFARAARQNPLFATAGAAEGRALHFFFLDAVPKRVEATRLEALRGPREAWAIRGRTFYLFAPDGFHASKLAANVEGVLGVRATSRNWRTVGRLLELAGRAESNTAVP
jgi:uncharacterized protein (DUF1697 family)